MTRGKRSPEVKNALKLMRRERKIEKEFDEIQKEMWEQQGLAKRFPTKFMDGNFFYNHIATTEQQDAIDSHIWVEEIHSDYSGSAVKDIWATSDFIYNTDKYLS